MRLFSKKSIILLICLILFISLTFSCLKVNRQKINIICGVLLISLLIYEIITEIGENYDAKPQSDIVLSMVDVIVNKMGEIKLRETDVRIKDIVPRLRFFEARKSFTINKQYVHICLRDKNGEMYHQNQLILVMLHEIAHVLCKEVGHTPKFQSILDELLIEARKVGLYNPNIPHIDDYCEY
jgi:hypothetical protein